MTEKKINLDYFVGDVVNIGIDPKTKCQAVITSITINSYDGIAYWVAWFNNGDRKTACVEPQEIISCKTPAHKNVSIGFNT